MNFFSKKYTSLIPVLEDPVIKDCAAAHNCTGAQTCLAWILGKGHALVTKSQQESRMRENLGAAGINLTEEEMQSLDQLPKTTKQRLSLLDPYTVP